MFSRCEPVSPSPELIFLLQGKFIEGLFGLSALTKDPKYRDQALRTLVDGIKKTKNWNNLQKGYITEGQSGDPAKGNDGRQFKAIYVRALTEVYRREWKNAGLRKLVKAYLNINVSLFWLIGQKLTLLS